MIAYLSDAARALACEYATRPQETGDASHQWQRASNRSLHIISLLGVWERSLMARIASEY